VKDKAGQGGFVPAKKEFLEVTWMSHFGWWAAVLHAYPRPCHQIPKRVRGEPILGIKRQQVCASARKPMCSSTTHPRQFTGSLVTRLCAPTLLCRRPPISHHVCSCSQQTHLDALPHRRKEGVRREGPVQVRPDTNVRSYALRSLGRLARKITACATHSGK
jgi:hypothetical protein